MKKRPFLLIWAVIFLLNHGKGFCQISINFNAAVNGQSVDALAFVQIINSSGEDVKASIVIRVEESSKGKVSTAHFSNVPLAKGSNTISPASFSRGQFSFGSNYNANILSQTGRFPEGDYEYCFEIEITDSKTQWVTSYFESCFNFQLQPLTPLLLINPPDEEESCNKRPLFTWQLPIPLPLNSKCRLILTEIRDAQDIAEAINFNIPLINQGNIYGNRLVFPAGSSSLREGVKYAWQVTVYNELSIIKKSEIWIYSVKCNEADMQPGGEGYRELKEDFDGNYYLTSRMVRFSFENPYTKGLLNYSIASKKDPSIIIKGLPQFFLVPGLQV